MPTNAQIAAIYDFEKVFELGLKALFTDRGLKAFTSQLIERTGDVTLDSANISAGYDLIDFQKDRPRVEITFVPGAGAGQFTNKSIAGIETPVETSWSGQYKMDIITECDIQAHADFRTQVRYLLHTQLLTINGVSLTLHKIQTYQRDGGTTPLIKAEEGYFQTTIVFDIDISIQDDAWDSLAT